MKIINSSSVRDISILKSSNESESLTMEKVMIEPAGQDEDTRISKERLEEIAGKLNEFLGDHNRSIKFVLHDELKEYYVQIINSETKEVVKEIPPKKLLDAFYTMKKFLGMVIDEKI